MYPGPDEVVTGNLADANGFYQELKFQVKPDSTPGTKKNERTFYFNPHFARTVKSGTVTVTEAEGVTYEKPAKPAEPKDNDNDVYVRTPRYLYDLSNFQTAEDGCYNYAAKGLFFKQELDLDYSTYTEGYAGSFKDTVTGNYKQYAIGKSTTDFTGAYDSQYHMIKNVFFRTDTGGY